METPTKIMKNLCFSLALMLIGSFAFANTKEVKPATNVVVKEVFVKSENTKSEDDKKNSCTVRITTPKGYNVTITIECECTQQEACNTAFHFASLGL